MRRIDWPVGGFTWYGIVAILAAPVAGFGCGDGDGGGGPSTPADVGGTWNVTASMSNDAAQMSCTMGGTFVINQNGSQLGGSYAMDISCTGPGGTASGPVSAPLSGSVVNDKVSLSDNEGCRFNGTAVGDPATAIGGQITCDVPVGSQTYRFKGPWDATR